ncbi:hypothetical protein AGLY_010598 [Aphis glycines]|uniref:Uncharacterized protein n=1 Tax=Aphis glycines TaxID=307491 RepID=A0A6G0TE09_APHGL|nr:hypothetical protein AGLY_010598 [Aphis glycines]
MPSGVGLIPLKIILYPSPVQTTGHRFDIPNVYNIDVKNILKFKSNFNTRIHIKFQISILQSFIFYGKKPNWFSIKKVLNVNTIAYRLIRNTLVKTLYYNNSLCYHCFFSDHFKLFHLLEILEYNSLCKIFYTFLPKKLFANVLDSDDILLIFEEYSSIHIVNYSYSSNIIKTKSILSKFGIFFKNSIIINRCILVRSTDNLNMSIKFKFLRNLSKTRKFAMRLNFKFLRNRVTITIYPQTVLNICYYSKSISRRYLKILLTIEIFNLSEKLFLKHNFVLLAFEIQILTKTRQNHEYLQIIL